MERESTALLKGDHAWRFWNGRHKKRAKSGRVFTSDAKNEWQSKQIKHPINKGVNENWKALTRMDQGFSFTVVIKRLFISDSSFDFPFLLFLWCNGRGGSTEKRKKKYGSKGPVTFTWFGGLRECREV